MALDENKWTAYAIVQSDHMTAGDNTQRPLTRLKYERKKSTKRKKATVHCYISCTVLNLISFTFRRDARPSKISIENKTEISPFAKWKKRTGIELSCLHYQVKHIVSAVELFWRADLYVNWNNEVPWSPYTSIFCFCAMADMSSPSWIELIKTSILLSISNHAFYWECIKPILITLFTGTVPVTKHKRQAYRKHWQMEYKSAPKV